ncbi:hypothetical protein TREMEDRAFT_24609 [Tremella mesenterica DSM 1558]|uniref:uncharacterized protein n=1 Tax=Tremella mesenterica (strain ATCC 24925 / CBS 8224 / DSM 1558 / NBRC 9311 / NRRL Y-6157 / RJB 2259-6 / UBC 559-6) TaxID=578456 RepID=UPI0003F4A16D|nr:uncharacterized protein TREMEDRAFT_24609 [Tremella mesenterica DSM 1558]EIW72506.1 hypothetical protein TREMEDRAFT_24609 [Tremella mesenterica DSM 1558]
MIHPRTTYYPFIFRPPSRVVLKSVRSFSSSDIRSDQAPPELINLEKLVTPSHHSLARQWLDGFKLEDIPIRAYEIKYSRSSGPGGQHVNKTESKATIRVPLSPSPWTPAFLLSSLSKSHHYLKSNPSLLISSQETRDRRENLRRALDILHQTLLQAGREVVMGHTSEKQKERVRGLIKAEKAKRRVDKTKRSETKADRGNH